jgi:hypothetical protein
MLTTHVDNDVSSQAPASSAPRTSDKPTPTQSGDNKDSSSASGKTTGSAQASGSQGSKTTGKPKTTSFDPRLPAGGVSMVTPNALAGDQFYKVGDFVTFAWNYTSLSAPPTSIDVLASCSANQATYTIAVNISAEQTKVVWDTENTPSGQAPFLTEKYTLLIYDSSLSVTAAPRPGYLGVFNQFTFGMYTPQAYVNWTGKHPIRKMAVILLTVCRFPVRQLRKERCALTLGKDDSESAPLHLRHDARLPSLLRPQLRSVVVHKHASRTIFDSRRTAFLILHNCLYYTPYVI